MSNGSDFVEEFRRRCADHHESYREFKGATVQRLKTLEERMKRLDEVERKVTWLYAVVIIVGLILSPVLGALAHRLLNGTP